MELQAFTIVLVGMVMLIEANSPDQCRCEEKINACIIRDGTPGANGLPGRDGFPGSKGEKGEQGLQGIQGPPGKAGPPGQKGDHGPTGQTGLPAKCDDTGKHQEDCSEFAQTLGKHFPLKTLEVKVLKTQVQDLQAQLQALKQEVNKSMKALQLPGGIRVGEKIFRTNGLRGTYQSATARCVIDGGVLASPRNAAENNALLEIVKAHNMHAILGINDIQTEGTFRYQNGETIGFTSWAKNEPNDGGGEDCAELLKNGLWNDISCTHERLIVCEY